MLVLIGIIGRLTSLSVGEIVYNLFTVKTILTYKVIILILIKSGFLNCELRVASCELRVTPKLRVAS